MARIKELLRQVIKMLKESCKNAQADWLEKRLHEMDTNEGAAKALKDIKTIIAGMGSLSDIYLEISKSISNDEARYNAIYRNLIKELDSEISLYLKNI